MKILIDECLPVDLRHSFSVHEAHTAEWAGLKGRKNGELLDAAEIAGYDVLLTIDQGFAHQQNLAGRKIGLLVLVAPSNQIEEWPLVPAARGSEYNPAGRYRSSRRTLVLMALNRRQEYLPSSLSLPGRTLYSAGSGINLAFKLNY